MKQPNPKPQLAIAAIYFDKLGEVCEKHIKFIEKRELCSYYCWYH